MSDTQWTIETEANGSIVSDGASIGVEKTLRVGSEYEVAFLFTGDGHLSEYETLQQYVQYHTDNTVQTGSTVEGNVWYRQNVYPYSGVSSYLFKFTPGDDVSIDAFWAVPTSMQDETRIVGAGERVSMTLRVIGTAKEYQSRSEVAQFEAEL